MAQEDVHDEPSLVALFTFVARHPQTKKATELNKLKPETAEENVVFEERQMVADARRAARNASAYEQHQGVSPFYCTCHHSQQKHAVVADRTRLSTAWHMPVFALFPLLHGDLSLLLLAMTADASHTR